MRMKKIMVVDNDIDHIQTVKQILEGADDPYEVICAGSGEKYMQWNERKIQDLPNSIGKISSPKNTPAGTGLESKVIDEVGIVCDYEDEIYFKIFQVIQYIEENDYAFRIAYWRYNEDKDRWIWGQFTQMISTEEWDELYQKAKAKGFFDKYKN